MRWSNSSSFRAASAVALLRELEPPALELAQLVEPVAHRRRLADERPCDERDRQQREQRGEHERDGHAATAPAA